MRMMEASRRARLSFHRAKKLRNKAWGTTWLYSLAIIAVSAIIVLFPLLGCKSIKLDGAKVFPLMSMVDFVKTTYAEKGLSIEVFSAIWYLIIVANAAIWLIYGAFWFLYTIVPFGKYKCFKMAKPGNRRKVNVHAATVCERWLNRVNKVGKKFDFLLSFTIFAYVVLALLTPSTLWSFVFLGVFLGVAAFFHFVCSLLTGTITELKLYEIAYPQISAGKGGIRARRAVSINTHEDVILDEKMRECGLGLFFWRNCFQVVCTTALAALFVGMEHYNNANGFRVLVCNLIEANFSAIRIPQILYFVAMLILWGCFAFAWSNLEYHRECFEDWLDDLRNWYRAGLGILILIGIVDTVIGFNLYAKDLSWICSCGFALVALLAIIVDFVKVGNPYGNETAMNAGEYLQVSAPLVHQENLQRSVIRGAFGESSLDWDE